MYPSLRLLVLRSAHIEPVKKFYETLGLVFAPEQHGSGPVHYAATIGTLVFEIYPATAHVHRDSTRLGFAVTNIEEILRTLGANGIRPKFSLYKKNDSAPRTAIVQDPEGRNVELYEQ